MRDGRQGGTANSTVVGGDAPRPAGPTAGSAGSVPGYTAPTLILLAAVAIFEGYMWLHLIPDGSLRPSGLLFAVAVVPVTSALTRGDPGTGGRLGRVTRLCSVAIPLLGVALLVSHATVWARLLGGVSLVFAVSALALAAASEHRGIHRSPVR